MSAKELMLLKCGVGEDSKKKITYFNWRLITLQYCIGFAIHQHESAMGVHFYLSSYLEIHMAESEEGLKSLLMKVKEESENAGF